MATDEWIKWSMEEIVHSSIMALEKRFVVAL